MWDLIISVPDHCLSFYFIWSVEMCFIFVAQLDVIFMRLLYEANIMCDCIIKHHSLYGGLYYRNVLPPRNYWMDLPFPEISET